MPRLRHSRIRVCIIWLRKKYEKTWMCLRRLQKVGVIVRGSERDEAIVTLMRENATVMRRWTRRWSTEGADGARGAPAGFNMTHRLALEDSFTSMKSIGVLSISASPDRDIALEDGLKLETSGYCVVDGGEHGLCEDDRPMKVTRLERQLIVGDTHGYITSFLYASR